MGLRERPTDRQTDTYTQRKNKPRARKGECKGHRETVGKKDYYNVLEMNGELNLEHTIQDNETLGRSLLQEQAKSVPSKRK